MTTPHRVCQKKAGPKMGRTRKHWINHRLAKLLFPFLENPRLWIEPPMKPAKRRGKGKLLLTFNESEAKQQQPQNNVFRETTTPSPSSTTRPANHVASMQDADLLFGGAMNPLSIIPESHLGTSQNCTLEELLGLDNVVSELDMAWLTSEDFDKFINFSALEKPIGYGLLHDQSQFPLTDVMHHCGAPSPDMMITGFDWMGAGAYGQNFLALNQ